MMKKIAASVFVGAAIFMMIRQKAIESIGELKYMKRETEKRKELIEESFNKRRPEYQTQMYLAEYVDSINAEKEYIHQLEEKIRNHWGWKILNPQKKYISRFDFL